MLVPELIAIHNHGIDAILLEEALHQQKLWIKILFCRPIIDDGYPPRDALPLLELPLVLEHAHHRRFEIVGLWSAKGDFDLFAASSLSLGQQRVQEGAAGVCIDLDQPGAVSGKVEVVTHEYANRPEIMSSDVGSPGQRRVAVAGQSCRGLDRVYDPKHLADAGFRQEYRHVREQMRLRPDEGPAEFRIFGLPLESLAQSASVQRDAEALTVQELGDRPSVGRGSSKRRSVHAFNLTLFVPNTSFASLFSAGK